MYQKGSDDYTLYMFGSLVLQSRTLGVSPSFWQSCCSMVVGSDIVSFDYTAHYWPFESNHTAEIRHLEIPLASFASLVSDPKSPSPKPSWGEGKTNIIFIQTYFPNGPFFHLEQIIM